MKGVSPLCCSRGEEGNSRTGSGAHDHAGAETGDSSEPEQVGASVVSGPLCSLKPEGWHSEVSWAKAGCEHPSHAPDVSPQTCHAPDMSPLGEVRKQKLSGKIELCDFYN